MMRNSGWMILLGSLAIHGLAGAQDEPELKVDKKASEAALFDTPARENSTTTATRTVPEQPPLFAQSEPVVVATWDNGQLSNLEVSATLATRRPLNMSQVAPGQFAGLPKKQQTNIIKRLAWEQILLAKARAAGLSEETPNIARQLAEQEEALLNRTYYQAEVIPALNESTLKSAKSYYEENKELFTEPGETIVRALHVSTYEMVTAEEGDTLEELATRISGDAKAADRIVQALPPFYVRSTPEELEEKALTAPLKAGEVLFVPLGDDAVSSATKLAETLRSDLESGKSIEDVEASTTDADFTVSATQAVRLSSAVGYWDELISAAKDMGETSVSKVIKTPTGLNILVLADRKTTTVVPFSNVQDDLMSRVVTDETQKRETVERTRKEVLDHLWKKYNVQVNRAVIEDSDATRADAVSTNTAIAQIGDFKYTLQQFLTDLRVTGKSWGQLTPDERTEVLRVAPTITNHVIAKEARALGLNATPEFKKSMQGTLESLLVKEYLKQYSDLTSRHVSDELLRAYYNDHIDKYTSAAQVTLRELSKRINMTLTPAAKAQAIENAKASLKEIKSRIKTEEDFAQLARRESEAISTRSRGGLIGTVSEDFRGAFFKNELRQIQIGEVSEPLLYGSEVMILRIDSRTPPTVQPFEEVRRRVIQDFSATEPSKMIDREMEADLKKANFELKF